MREQAILTIGLPFHNAQQTLADAIRSVYAQSHQDWELILIDDGSTDESLSIAQSVRDHRVRVVSDGRNLGLAARLNQIVDLANGIYIARMDADDLMHPQRLARQLQLLHRNSALDLVDTGLLSIDTDNQPVGKRCCSELRISSAGLISGHTPVHASIVARTEWFQQHRYDASLRRAQDFELWNRAHAMRSLRVKRLPEPLYFAREATAGTYTRTRLTHITKRRILRQHGPQAVGWRRTQAEILKSHCKQAAYFCAQRTGLVHQLVATRNEPLQASDERYIANTIPVILRTSVPGLPTSRLQPQAA